jgi:hypothetical protein
MFNETRLQEKRKERTMASREKRAAKARTRHTSRYHGIQTEEMTEVQKAALAAYAPKAADRAARKGWGGRVAARISQFFRPRAG